MNFRINISGVKELETKLKNVSEKVHKESLAEVADAAQEWELRSKRDAPVNFGKLRQGITHKKETWGASVTSNAYYSPYMEWGTITKVIVPADLADFAIQFKGRGLRVSGGVSPRPFFFKQMPIIKKLLIDRINAVLNNTKL